jgi:hypothetical protein
MFHLSKIYVSESLQNLLILLGFTSAICKFPLTFFISQGTVTGVKYSAKSLKTSNRAILEKDWPERTPQIIEKLYYHYWVCTSLIKKRG